MAPIKADVLGEVFTLFSFGKDSGTNGWSLPEVKEIFVRHFPGLISPD